MPGFSVFATPFSQGIHNSRRTLNVQKDLTPIKSPPLRAFFCLASRVRGTFEHFVSPLVQALAGGFSGNGRGSMHFGTNTQHHFPGGWLLWVEPLLSTVCQIILDRRLTATTEWLTGQAIIGSDIKIGYFGASTGAAAALVAASKKQDVIGAIVSRGGRPDLAGRYLDQVRAPTLLIVGGNDHPVIGMNQEAFERLKIKDKSKPELTWVPRDWSWYCTPL